MAANPTKTAPKRTLSKAYTDQWLLESAIQAVLENRSADTQLSLLGNLDDANFEDGPTPMDKIGITKKYWRRLLGDTANFGLFSNPETGTIFTVGHLTDTFLRDVEGTKLAELSAGPSGILRGLGVAPEQAAAHIKTLAEGGFLLMVRGYDQELKKLEETLASLEC